MDDENSEAVVAMIDALDAIHDRASFLVFVDALRRNLEEVWAKEQENPWSPWGRGRNDWENMSLSGFLEAAVAWARDKPMPDEPSWWGFAHFLHARKVYE